MLTYCTNIHPGESWQEITDQVWSNVLRVKERVSPIKAFPVGLRLSALAARQATTASALAFLDRCNDQGCFIPTLNGFPYGGFHRQGVKEHAYLPDWRSKKRVEYIRDLIRLLQLWLPPPVTGSISTVPVGLRHTISRDDLPLIRNNLLLVLQDLEKAAGAGRKIILALEPEPGCFLESAAEVVSFVDSLQLPAALRPFLGVCFDCCHAAVLHEEPGTAFALLADAGIVVAKVHVSSAVRLTKNHLQAAKLFDDDRYFHQTTISSGQGQEHFNHLDEALMKVPGGEEEWRIHYHLPIFDDGNDSYGTTNGFIREVLSCCPPQTLLEIETYTYDHLPPELQQGDVIDSISREFSWLRARL